MRSRRWSVIGIAALFGVLSVTVGLSSSAAADSGERIISFRSQVAVSADARLRVTETIRYDFGGNSRRGIFRNIPVVNSYDDQFDRVVKVEDVLVTSPTGASTQTEVTRSGSDLVIRIGDPDRYLTGEQTYVIQYDVQGAMNAFDDHAELYWNVTGNGWDVPIDSATAVVAGPVPPTQAACFEGVVQSNLPCARQSIAGRSAAFAADPLSPGEGMSVVVGYPPTSITVPPPILNERWSVSRAFSVAPGPLSLALLTLLAGVGGVGYIGWARGRDRRYIGQVPGLAPTRGERGSEERKPLVGGSTVVVDFAPPKDSRPGEIGTLIDERADVLDVTATIVDLAVRGYLRIDEVPQERGWFTERDWMLRKLRQADAELHRYELTLFEALFRGRDEVNLSALKQTFASDLSTVRTQLYDGVVLAGWFRSRPDITRFGWSAFGVLLALVGVGLTYVLARFTHFGLAGIAAVLAGLALVVAGRYMPARTGRGSAVLAQALGFRQYIRTAEAGQIRFEEREGTFSRYLPYAIVFGEADRWSKTFAALGAAGAAGASTGSGINGLYWYGAYGAFAFSDFNESMSAFTTTTAGSIAAAAPSSSGGSGFSAGGGFSGGGFGGGGGGSW